MYLREFDIHYAGDVLKERKDRAKIGFQTRCVTALFEKCFAPRFVTKKQWKISVEAVEKVTKLDPRVGDVIVVQVPLDVVDFFRSDNLKKKRIALETLFEGIKRVCQGMNWPIQPFDAAYQGVVAKNFTNEWVHGKTKRSPTKKYFAEIYCVHEVDTFRMYLLLRDSAKRELKRFLLKEEIPSEFVFSEYLGLLEWVSENEVAVASKGPASHWLVNVEEAP